jgi:hypothetical protein
MIEINQWLSSSRDYAAGVAIYKRYGKYERVKYMLEKSPSPLLVEKLNQVMSDLAQQYSQEVEARTEAIKENGQNVSGQNLSKTELHLTPPDQYLLDLEKKWKPAYAEMSVMHSRLLMATTIEARFALAQHITHLEALCIDCWQKRDHYIKNGAPMADKKKKAMRKDITNYELRALLNARSALSQYRNIHLPKAMAELHARPSKKAEKRVQRMRDSIARYEGIIKQFEL